MKTISAERIAQIEARRDELQAMMATGDLPSDRFVAVSKEYAELEPVANAAAEVRRLRQEADSLAFMTQDGDDELRELAAEELHANRNALAAADRHLALALLPRDAADERAAMLEIRAGTGGDEAALFAGDLFRMYQRYAERQGWRVEVISASVPDTGGYKEVVASVAGAGELDRPMAQVALAWVVSRPGVSSVLMGASRAEQMIVNMASLDIAFSPEQQARLDAAGAPPMLNPYFIFQLPRAQIFGGSQVAPWTGR